MEKSLFYLFGVWLIKVSKSERYLGTLRMITSLLVTDVSGARRVFMYSNQGMLLYFDCNVFMVIALYKAVAFLLSSFGSEI